MLWRKLARVSVHANFTVFRKYVVYAVHPHYSFIRLQKQNNCHHIYHLAVYANSVLPGICKQLTIVFSEIFLCIKWNALYSSLALNHSIISSFLHHKSSKQLKPRKTLEACFFCLINFFILCFLIFCLLRSHAFKTFLWGFPFCSWNQNLRAWFCLRCSVSSFVYCMSEIKGYLWAHSMPFSPISRNSLMVVGILGSKALRSMTPWPSDFSTPIRTPLPSKRQNCTSLMFAALHTPRVPLPVAAKHTALSRLKPSK